MLFFCTKAIQAKCMFSLSSHPEIPDTSIKKALLMQKMLIAVAENGSLDENVYSSIRREFMNSDAKSLLPEIIKTCRDQGSVWGYLKNVSSGNGSWAVRRNHIRESFTPFWDHLEKGSQSPSDDNISNPYLPLMLTEFITHGKKLYKGAKTTLKAQLQQPEHY